LGCSVAVIGQWTNKTQSFYVVASGVSINRILERASGHRCSKGRR
jgi:hypothetical protein